MEFKSILQDKRLYSVNVLSHVVDGYEFETSDVDQNYIWTNMLLNDIIKDKKANDANKEAIVFVAYELKSKMCIGVEFDRIAGEIDFDEWLIAKKMTKAINLAFKRGTIRIV